MLTAACVLALAALSAVWLCAGRAPLRDLSTQQLRSVTVRMIPPSVQFELRGTDVLEQASALLREVRVYRHMSPQPASGQFVEFVLEMQDGTRVTVQPLGSVVWLNGECFAAKSAPNEALSAFANKLLS